MNQQDFKLSLKVLAIGLLLSGCAVLHRTQLSEIDSKAVQKGQRFEVQVSETGVNLKEAASVAQLFTRDEGTSKQIRDIQQFISMFQMGPHTGEMVFNEHYPEAVAGLLLTKCPSGHISSLMSIRETAKYPVVSGEIIKLIGYCLN